MVFLALSVYMMFPGHSSLQRKPLLHGYKWATDRLILNVETSFYLYCHRSLCLSLASFIFPLRGLTCYVVFKNALLVYVIPAMLSGTINKHICLTCDYKAPLPYALICTYSTGNDTVKASFVRHIYCNVIE